jgi:hypothetical protein
MAMGLGVQSAAAEWIYNKEEKAFGETQAMAMSIGDASIAFVTCKGDGLSVSLATPEDWTDAGAAMNLLQPKLIVSIDGQKPDRYDIRLNENTVHKIIGATQDEDVARRAAEKMAEARKRIDIGLELAGERYHASKLSAAGATKKIQAVLEACPEQKKADDDTDKDAPDKK